MTDQKPSTAKPAETSPPVVPIRHYGRWIASVIVAILLALLIYSIARNPSFEWPTVGHYLFNTRVLTGVGVTAELTAGSMLIGLALGTLLAVMRLSHSPLLVAVSAAYGWVFRSVPTLVQLLFWFNFAALYQTVRLGIPAGPGLFEWNTTGLINPFTAAFLGLGLDQAAYTSEVVRAGIMSVGTNQRYAAKALGMGSGLTFRRVIYPQAMRLIIPPLSNELISMLKNTSLVSIIAVGDLLYTAQKIYARTYETIPLLVVATLWYLAIVSLLNIAQHFLEKRFAF